jgi:hypothetical protein
MEHLKYLILVGSENSDLKKDLKNINLDLIFKICLIHEFFHRLVYKIFLFNTLTYSIFYYWRENNIIHWSTVSGIIPFYTKRTLKKFFRLFNFLNLIIDIIDRIIRIWFKGIDLEISEFIDNLKIHREKRNKSEKDGLLDLLFFKRKLIEMGLIEIKFDYKWYYDTFIKDKKINYSIIEIV